MEDQWRHLQQQKVERFLKLGYDYSAIVRVLESLRHDAQTNDILEELIKTCHSPGSRLVPRGCSPVPAQARGSTAAAAAAAAAGQETEGSGGGGGAAGGEGGGGGGRFRRVVIDGSNVAMSHGDKKVFSCQGLQLAVDWFWDKGLRDIIVFIPLWRKEARADALITDQHILHELEQRKMLVYTPSRCVNGKRVVCYDDRYIVKVAFDSDGVIVSNDNYRDLQTENPRWKRFIEERLLMFSFVNDKFMPPDDPLGRNGPTIDDFLRRKPWTPENKLQHCPYGKKCTYGVKCKFYHPERLHQSQLSVADELRAQSDRARSFSPKPGLQEPHRGLPTSSPLALTPEDTPLRSSSNQRDGSFGHQRQKQQTSLEADEAFSSLESSLSRLYLQEAPYSGGSFSSGVASYGPDSRSLSGSFSGYSAPGPAEGASCRSCTCCTSHHHQDQLHQQAHHQTHHRQAHHHQHNQDHQHHQDHLHQQAWVSCPALPPLNGGSYSDMQYYVPPPGGRQSHSLPREPWGRGQCCRGTAQVQAFAGDPSSSSSSSSSSRRRGLRSQLGALFPQSTVERLLDTYPHVSDMSELMRLIQNKLPSNLSF